MPLVPLLNDNSFRIIGLMTRNPDITVAEIASVIQRPVPEVNLQISLLRQAKLLKNDSSPWRTSNSERM